MKIKLLLATDDSDYSDHLSNEFLTNYSESIVMTVCSSPERLPEMLKEQKYDVALLETYYIEDLKLTGITLPLILWSEEVEAAAYDDLIKIRKYQRISAIYTDILENFAKITRHSNYVSNKTATISVVWSPAGGVGKTTVSLALAAKKASEGRQIMYLNLELFSATPVYFDTTGKSISKLFELLESNEGNAELLIKSIIRKDAINNISYFCCPKNFDDLNILSVENIKSLINACSELTEELIIDMSCLCDIRTRYIFEIADRILLVSDQTKSSGVKLEQFINRHNLFSQIRYKTIYLANKGATVDNNHFEKVISLPPVQSADDSEAYRRLSGLINI